MSVTKRDLWIYPVEITASNQTIVFNEGAGSGTANVATGTYWAYRDSAAPAAFSSDYPSLYDAVETALNASASGTYEFEAYTPLDSPEFIRGGLNLTQTAGSGNFGFQTTSVSWTFPHYLLGITDDGTYNEAQTPPWVSDHSRGGLWQSPRPARQSFGGAKHVQFANTGNRETRQVRRWRTDHTRLISYHWVPAGHIHHRANENSSYAAGASLTTGDHGNYLYDLWLHGLSGYQDVLIVHNVEETDIRVSLFDLGDGWSVASVLNDEDAEDFENLISLENRTGAHFGVDIPIWSRSYEDVSDSYGDTIAATYYRRKV